MIGFEGTRNIWVKWKVGLKILRVYGLNGKLLDTARSFYLFMDKVIRDINARV